MITATKVSRLNGFSLTYNFYKKVFNSPRATNVALEHITQNDDTNHSLNL